MVETLERREAVQLARRLWQANPVYMDTETTGTGPTAEIIEIAIIDQDGKLLFESLVKPRGAIEPDAIRVHGITPDQLQTSPGWAEVWPQAWDVLAGRQVGTYNSEFDIRLIKQSHKLNWINQRLQEENFFCIMKLYARFYGNFDPRSRSYRWQTLEQARQQCNLPLPNSHRAQDDALLARALLEYMANWTADR